MMSVKFSIYTEPVWELWPKPFLTENVSRNEEELKGTYRSKDK